MNIDTVALLIDHIRDLHRCPCDYVRSVRVQYTYKDRSLWNGKVGIFRLALHGEQVECYAWESDGMDGMLPVPAVFLHTHEIRTPKAAVRAHILQLCQELAA